IYSCNFTARTCPPLAAPTSAPAVTP
ncbi:DUF4079 domain-containing protein, partial [Pseudomonas sp. HMWF031]